jgi:hypothetical protein
MSGCGFTTYCPVCGTDSVNAYSDHKPFPIENGECLQCGFNYSTQKGKRMTLAEINFEREDQGMEKLTKKEYDKYKKADFEKI